MQTNKYTGGEYLEQVPDWHVGDSEWKSGLVFEMIHRHQLTPRSLVDIGCGAGNILARLQERMPEEVELSGYDVSPQAIELCRTRANDRLSFFNEDFLEAKLARFDLALLLDVFEHVPDYLGFLKALSTRARHFIFHIPLDSHVTSVARNSNHMLHMRERYGHLHYFTPETALATLQDTGYEVVDTLYSWDNERFHPTVKEFFTSPASSLFQSFDRMVFKLRPEWAARFRPHFNLLVLARPA